MVKLRFENNDVLNRKIELSLSLGELLVLSKNLDIVEGLLKDSDLNYNNILQNPDDLIIKLARVKDNVNSNSMVMLRTDFYDCTKHMNIAIDSQLNNESLTVNTQDPNSEDVYLKYDELTTNFEQVAKDSMTKLFNQQLTIMKEKRLDS